MSTSLPTSINERGLPTHRKFRFPVAGNDITVSLVELDARDADRLLELNTDNRKLRKAKVEEYRRAILRGDFHFNGDAIRISRDGVLLDGQHRLEALRQTLQASVVKDTSNGEDDAIYNSPPARDLPKILVLIVDGLDPIARETIDVGATRTAANLLEFGADRMRNAINVAALGRAAMTMEDPKQSMPSKQEVVHYVHAHREALEAAYLHGHRTIENSPLKGGTTPYALAAYLIGQVESDQEIIRFFFRKLSTGEGLVYGDPILTLRNRLISNPPTTAGGSRSRYLRNTSLFLRAWNAFANGQTLKTLKTWGEGQAYPEAKPVTEAVRERLAAEAVALEDGDCDQPLFSDRPAIAVDSEVTEGQLSVELDTPNTRAVS